MSSHPIGTDRRGILLIAPAIVGETEVWSPGWVHVIGSRIEDCGGGEPPPHLRASAVVQSLRGVLIPGFVDIHSHGAAGVGFADAAERPIDAAIGWHLEHGTTSLIASLATASLDDLERQTSALAPYVRDGRLRGVHLEGPWLAPARRGAHAAHLLRTPAPGEVERLTGSSKVVRMVTIAPELDGGIDAIETMVASGIVVAVGHTACDTATARAAFDAGATVATHLFNGMPPFHHREPGPVGAALLDERVTLELILDGHHLAAAAVDLVLRSAGSRVAAVSDSISATGSAVGDLELAGSHVRVRDGVATTVDTGALAGSTATLDTAFAALVRDHGLPLPAAVAATSTSAAVALNFTDLGRIAPGMTADLVLLDGVDVTAVMKSGAWKRRPLTRA